MCKPDSGGKNTASPNGMNDAIPDQCHASEPGAGSGSRRRRLWELPGETHCPVIGVCLPIAALRKLICKALGAQPIADDYEFHVAAVAECARRHPISELLQRELDRRFAPALRHFAQAKTTSALRMMWDGALQDNTAAEALWPTLTHPRCDEALRQKVCRDIHMFQHQAGASARADLQRLAALHEQNLALVRELAALKERHGHDLRQRDAEAVYLDARLAQARGQLTAREAETVQLREQLAALEKAVPSLPARMDLLQRVEQQHQQVQRLERDRDYWQRQAQQLQQLTDRASALATETKYSRAREEQAVPVEPSSGSLRDKAVLCVGGRPATVPTYRQMIECSGGRFLHHDGGAENSAAQLEAGLAAADLVICQTGCVSHGAYWRVKDYCKRTGKQCVFVEKPSSSSLARCLRSLGLVEGGDEKNAHRDATTESRSGPQA